MPISNGHSATVAVGHVEQIEEQLMRKHFPALKTADIELALLLLYPSMLSRNRYLHIYFAHLALKNASFQCLNLLYSRT